MVRRVDVGGLAVTGHRERAMLESFLRNRGSDRECRRRPDSSDFRFHALRLHWILQVFEKF
jgi:hypothetical protein